MTCRISLRELCGELGCDERQIGLWEKAGLSYVTKKGRRGGRPAHLYDREEALRWVSAKGTGKWPMEASRLLRKGEEKPPAEKKKKASAGTRKKKASAAGGTLQDETTNALLVSAEKFRWWSEQESAAGERGDLAAAAICAKQRVEAGKAVAQMQEMVTNQAKEMGVLVVASEMEGRYMKVLATVRNNILGVPDSIMPVMMPFLRDPEDAAKVKELMERKIEDALRHIAGAKGNR